MAENIIIFRMEVCDLIKKYGIKEKDFQEVSDDIKIYKDWNKSE